MTDLARRLRADHHVVARAPGRVNLIGEHTDYSGGFVLPMAIPQHTTVTLARRSDDVVRLVSTDVESLEPMTFVLGAEQKRSEWIDYVQGTTRALRAAGHRIAGFDALVESTVPMGSGLSSSAALEVALLRGLRALFGLDVDDVAVATIARAAETDFVGVPVGIMDPMASSLGDVTSALFLDTRSLAYERVALPAGLEVVVIDSGIAHANASSGYRDRHRECAEAAAELGVAELRDVDDIARCRELPSPLDRRARHVISENARVKAAVACLRAGSLGELGQLLDASHASLRDDFEVSVPGVDRLVAIAQADPDVIGARMTGGGFGGAIVALARRGRAAAAAARVSTAYERGGPERARVLLPAVQP